MSAHATGTPVLAEVGEADAVGAVASLYAEIRGATGLPVVNLVYRHLATVPGRLEGVWAALEPNARHVLAGGLAAELLAAAPPPPVAPIPRAALAAAGVDAAVLAGVRATLDAYRRGNATNLIVLTALRHGAPGASGEPPPFGAGPEAPSPVGAGGAATALPAMRPPRDFPPAGRALLSEMAAAVAGGEEPVLVPSLLRHLTEPPAFLALAWTNICVAVRSAAFDAAARALAAGAAAVVPSLPCQVAPSEDAEVRRILGRFLAAIPRALLLGTMLGECIEPTPEGEERDDHPQ